MSHIVIDENYCKGCALCVEVCPRHCMEMDASRLTAKGYHPARLCDADACTACAICSTMCPDVAITVIKD
ncbi:MAG: ferredoxin family protein [Actinomycetes bacterium]|jgi:2-oxoglutarate ferredoxin oxidoreductase subunit delta|nr:ferredoxin family protein [Actinomycetes bacterium]